MIAKAAEKLLSAKAAEKLLTAKAAEKLLTAKAAEKLSAYCKAVKALEELSMIFRSCSCV